MAIPNLLTVEEAAERLGVSVATVRRRCADGEISARKSGRNWLIDEASLPARRARPKGRRKQPPSALVDLPLALTHLRTQDLRHDVWAPDVLRFEDDLGSRDELIAAAAARVDLEDPFDPPTYVPVPKSPVFPRNAVDLSLTDRLAYQALVGSFAHLLDAEMTESVYSARLSRRRSHFLRSGRDAWLTWRRDVAEAVRAGDVWMAETDITAFFDFIKHELLLPELQQVGVEPGVVGALREMLRTWTVTPNTGVPQGPNASRVLANFYLSPVDAAMRAGTNISYFRYMDDIRIVGSSRAEVIGALQVLDGECRRRGLALSTKKTELHEGEQAIRSLEDRILDELQYAVDFGDDEDDELRKKLALLFTRSLKTDGLVNTRHARFSLGRLYRLRDHTVANRVLDNLELLAPLREIAPKYLHPFLGRKGTQRRLSQFLADPDRNSSPFLSSWLLAVMTDLRPPLPDDWVDYARKIALDRSAPAYHRAVALSVLALGHNARDLNHIEQVIHTEHDPEVVRAALVALKRIDRLSRAVENRARRISGMETTIGYLRSASDLPSVVFASRRTELRRR